ncbi:unnamed protein product [Urochloa decumbens]|uniref:F-box domain-containing protein n=1 Tax=Urochloa decumbens TaxID=240449 RepID=A0ABC9B570_9POAL
MELEDAFRKRVRTSGGDGDGGCSACPDWLSSLPDCLLHVIMSFMKARQAVQTCVLSKRWRHLWHSVPCLDIDFDEFKKKACASDNSSATGGNGDSGSGGNDNSGSVGNENSNSGGNDNSDSGGNVNSGTSGNDNSGCGGHDNFGSNSNNPDLGGNVNSGSGGNFNSGTSGNDNSGFGGHDNSASHSNNPDSRGNGNSGSGGNVNCGTGGNDNSGFGGHDISGFGGHDNSGSHSNNPDSSSDNPDSDGDSYDSDPDPDSYDSDSDIPDSDRDTVSSYRSGSDVDDNNYNKHKVKDEYKDWEDFEDFAVSLMYRCDIAQLDSFRLNIVGSRTPEFGYRHAAGWLRRMMKYCAPGRASQHVGLSSGSWRLKRLHLGHVHLDNRFGKHVSSVCHSLEELELDNCTCEIRSMTSHSLKTLVLKNGTWRNVSKITSPTLKTLVLDGVSTGDHVLVILAPAVAYLHLDVNVGYYHGSISIKEMPSIAKASIYLRDHRYSVFSSKLCSDQFKLLCSISNVTNLELFGFGIMVLGEEPEVLEFKNLRNLLLDNCDLSNDLDTLVFFLQRSPVLEKLTLRCCEVYCSLVLNFFLTDIVHCLTSFMLHTTVPQIL